MGRVSRLELYCTGLTGILADCPRNWTRYDRTKSCFYVIEQRLRWSEAERQCQRQGGHLASVVDEYENIFVFGKLLKLQFLTLKKSVKNRNFSPPELNHFFI